MQSDLPCIRLAFRRLPESRIVSECGRAFCARLSGFTFENPGQDHVLSLGIAGPDFNDELLRHESCSGFLEFSSFLVRCGTPLLEVNPTPGRSPRTHRTCQECAESGFFLPFRLSPAPMYRDTVPARCLCRVSARDLPARTVL
jgi:hypothetical protein